MTIQDNKQTLRYPIDDKFAFNFEVLQNIQVGKRKASTGFMDKSKLCLYMRDGTSRYGNKITGGSGGVSGLYFFVDFKGDTHPIIGYDNKVWHLDNSDDWNDFTSDLGGNTFNFDTVKLPMMLNYTTPTEYTTPKDGSGSELIPKDAGDSGGAANIGKVLFITENTPNGEVYQGAWGFIMGYDTSADEYILGDSGILGNINSSGNLVGIGSGSKYMIFDTIGEFLQVCNGSSWDRYYYVDGSGDFQEFTPFQGLGTKALRKIQAFSSSQFLRKQIYWNNSYYTFVKGVVYFTSGNVNNPFFYTYTGSLTIPGIKGGDILDLFIFRNRLIIGGNNFIAYINKFTNLTQVELLTNVYGMKQNSLIDVGVDAYFLSSDRELYSLAETITGTLRATNVTEQVGNYVGKFNVNICGGFDGRRLFLYGEEDFGERGTIVVLDIYYKFWSTYTGLSPSSFTPREGVMYFTDTNSSTVGFFDSETIKDIGGEDIEQLVEVSEIILGDVWTDKTISDLWFWLDNYTQEVYVDAYIALTASNTKKNRWLLKRGEVNTSVIAPPMGQTNMGDGILGGDGYTNSISYPFLEHIQLDSDRANIWKIRLTGKDGSPFYLNDFAISIGFAQEEKVYFNPTHTQ